MLYIAAKVAHASVHPTALHLCMPSSTSLYTKMTLPAVITKELVPYSMYCPELVVMIGMIVQAHTASASCQKAAFSVAIICSATCSER